MRREFYHLHDSIISYNQRWLLLYLSLLALLANNFLFSFFLRGAVSIIKTTEKKRRRAVNDAAVFLSNSFFFFISFYAEYTRREENPYYTIGINN